MLNDEHIVSFQSLYRKHYGVELSRNDALEKALRLVQLYKLVYLANNTKPRGKRRSEETAELPPKDS